LDSNNIYIILIPFLLVKLGLKIFVKYILPKINNITNKIVKNLLLGLLVIVLLFWYTYLFYCIWNFFIISGITLEILSFLYVFAKNLLLVNDNLYCESTTSFWREAFGEAGELPTSEPLNSTNFPPTPLKVWTEAVGREQKLMTCAGEYKFFTDIISALRQTWGNLVNYGVNFNLIDILFLELKKNNLFYSSLMLNLNPAMESDPLNAQSFDSYLIPALNNLPPLTNDTVANLNPQDLKNLCIFYSTRAMDIQKVITSDLVEVAINRNWRNSRENLNTILKLATGFISSNQVENYIKIIGLNIENETEFNKFNDAISEAYEQEYDNTLPLYYTENDRKLFRGISKSVEKIFAEKQIGDNFLPLELSGIIGEFFLADVIGKAHESFNLIKQNLYEGISLVHEQTQNDINYYSQTRLLNLEWLMDHFYWIWNCTPTQQLHLTVLLFSQLEFELPLRGDDLRREKLYEVFFESLGFYNFKEFSVEIEGDYNNTPANQNRLLSFFSSYEYAPSENTFRFRNNNNFKVNTPVSMSPTSQSKILDLLPKSDWTNKKMITSSNIGYVSERLRSLPLDEDGRALINQKYSDSD
jgi:hypothetical protein